MRILTSKQTGNRSNIKDKKTGICDSMERILMSLFIIVFTLFIGIQAALTDAGMRGLFVREAMEGEPLGDEVFLFKKCRMELELVGMSACPELKVLVNGTEKGDFRYDKVLLELKEGDVVELDASRLLINVQIRISAVSRNLPHLLGRTVSASDGIVPVAVAIIDQ